MAEMLHKEKGKIAKRMKRTGWTQGQRAQKERNIENRVHQRQEE